MKRKSNQYPKKSKYKHYNYRNLALDLLNFFIKSKPKTNPKKNLTSKHKPKLYTSSE